MADDPRLRSLNDKPDNDAGRYVLYWMQQAARTRYNHALECAIADANRLDLPPIVCFGLMDNYPEANARHYLFLLQGLRDVETNLKARGIKLVVRHGSPERAAIHFGEHAATIVCDRGYLRHQKRWRDAVADAAACRVVEIESDVVVPVELVSSKHESAARTIRPKIRKRWDEFLTPVRTVTPKHASLRSHVTGDIEVGNPEATLLVLKLDRSIEPVPQYFTGGENAASKLIDDFTRHKLGGYAAGRNEPASDRHSYMSMYLHFGHVSPIESGLVVRKTDGAPASDQNTYLEELIVRRELSMSFCNFEPKYD